MHEEDAGREVTPGGGEGLERCGCWRGGRGRERWTGTRRPTRRGVAPPAPAPPRAGRPPAASRRRSWPSPATPLFCR